MRGVISPKLSDFIEQANTAAEQAKASGVLFSPSLVRGNLDKLVTLIGQGPDLDFVQDRSINTTSHNIPVRVYSPEPEKSLPVVIHFHGGGHMCGSIELYDAISRKIAKAGHCIVITVEYRLAPEHPYPEGIEDCQHALELYQSVLEDVNFSEQLILAGDSAGGAICTTLISNNLNNDNVKINKQVLIYPSVDYTVSQKSVTENGSGFLLETSKIDWYFNHYFQHNEPRKSVSPLYMPMSKNMPETLIFTSSCDPLRDEGIAYGVALTELGVNVIHHHFEGLTHAYMLLDSLIHEECNETYQLIGKFIRA